MATYSKTQSVYYSGSESTQTKWSQSYYQITIPTEYSINNVPLYWRIVRTSNSGGGTYYLGITYKTNLIGEQVITTQLNNNYQLYNLQLQGATTFKIRFYTYVALGGSGYTDKSSTFYIKIPFGGPTGETIITAAKLNEIATKNGVSASATQGNLIQRTPWQTIGTAVGVTFDSTKPLKQNLDDVIYNTPGSWTALSTW